MMSVKLLSWEKVNATLPKDVEAKDVTMEMAVQLITEKAGKKPTKKKAAPKKKAAAKKKPAAKKAPAKKKAAPKTAAKDSDS